MLDSQVSRRSARRRPPSLLLLAPLLFGSGASALIYQVLWLRLLSLVFGVTVYAATAVLAGFMGGLALGSAVAGRLADRVRSPLRTFGFVEVGIGAAAFATQGVLAGATPLYIGLQAALPDSLPVQNAIRFAGSFLILLIPTTLMGMTLPLAVKAAEGTPDQTGRRIGIVYATNTAGAVAGALLAGFLLIGAIGIGASFQLAAVTNVTVGVVALLFARSATSADAAATERSRPAATTRLPRIAVLVFGLSGFAALALEVLWFRALVYFVPATTYAFSTMLSAVLLGLSLGSYAATPLLQRNDSALQRLAWLQLATALAIPASAIALSAAYRTGAPVAVDALVSLLLVFPPAFLMGMSYPVGLQAWAGGANDSDALHAASIGDLNSANLIGGILGAVAGGFIALPSLGTRASIAGFAAVYVVTFFLLLPFAVRPQWRRVVALGAAVLFVLVALEMPDMVEAVSGRRYPAGERLFWRKEGAQTTAVVRIRPLGGRLLYLNGLHQASDGAEMVRLHRLIGHLPMVLHPSPKRALVIGLGGGATPGAVSQHAVAVDVVELSPSVVEAAEWFTHVNYDVAHRPNVRLRIDDGRRFLLAARQKYDVITADVIQPEHAGAGNLYSIEYFRLVRESLAPGGLALQWIGSRPEVEYKLILRTFLAAFPEATLWAGGQLLVGGTAALAINRDAFEQKLQHAPTRAALQEIALDSFEQLADLYVAGPPELGRFAGDGRVLTDDRPSVEYFRSLPEGAPDVDVSALRGDIRRHLH